MIKLSVLASRANTFVDPVLGRAGGAEVTCFVMFPDKAGALELAKYYATRDGQWRIAKFGTPKRMSAPTAANRGYVSEALKAGYSLVFHIYPKEIAS